MEKSLPARQLQFAKTAQKGIVGIVLLIVAAIVGIVIWVASGDSVDAREGSNLSTKSIANAIVQQAVSLEQGVGDMISRNVAPEQVQLSDLFTNGLLKPIQLPPAAVDGTILASSQAGMSFSGWSLLQVQVSDTRGGPPGTFMAAVSTTLKTTVCQASRRMVADTAFTVAGVFAGGSYAAGTQLAAAPLIAFNTEYPVSGCATDSAGATFYVHIISRLF